MELLDALLQNRPEAAESPLRSWGVRRPVAAYENLRRIIFTAPPPLFEPLYLFLDENLRRNADPDRALNNLERFHQVSLGPLSPMTLATERPFLLGILLDLFGFSQFMSDVLIRYPHYAAWLGLPETLDAEMSREMIQEDLGRNLAALDAPDARHRAAIQWLRRMLLRLGARVMTGLADEESFMRELSECAAALIQTAVDEADRVLEARFGRPIEESGEGDLSRRRAQFTVIGMGKLGGLELNFSSDIDLMFIYSAEGWTTGTPSADPSHVQGRISNHDFFNRLSEQVVTFLSTVTDEGYLYRVDTRLRPDGIDGPLALSLAAFEIYHETQARPWERLALIKGLAIAGDETLCATFDRMSRAFVFDRVLRPDLVRQVRELKWKIDAEVLAGEKAGREIKRGEGGIREIEFLVQTLQLLHGPARPRLRERGTLRTLAALEAEGLLAERDAGALREDYLFLRKIEHRLQMMELRQTHTLPDDPEEIETLARRCGLTAGIHAPVQGNTLVGRLSRAEVGTEDPSPKLAKSSENRFDSAGVKLLSRWNQIRDRVHSRFVSFFGGRDDPTASTPAEAPSAATQAAHAILSGASEKDLARHLAGFGLESPSVMQSFKRMGGMGRSVYLTDRGQELYAFILPDLIAAAAESPRPEGALANLESFMQASGSFTSVYEVFRANPRLLRLLLRAFGMANSTAQTLIAHPEYFDYLLEPGRLEKPLDEEEIGQRLARSAGDLKDTSAILARIRRFEYLMTCLAEIGGIFPFEKAAVRLSRVAEILIEGALSAVRAPAGPDSRFCVLSMGKLGARELNYFSDLDLVFCWDAPGDPAKEDEAATAAAAAIVGCLTHLTSEGAPFSVDSRLRPEGASGPLAPPLSRYLDYYRRRAELWEFQSALKLRAVAGDRELGEKFLRGVFRIARERLSGMDWKDEIIGPMRRMRRRIEESVRIPSWILCDLKKGFGGLIDLEFIAQCFQFQWLRDSPPTGDSPPAGGMRADEVFAEHARRGLLDSGDAEAMQYDYRFMRRLESRARLLFETERSWIPASGETLEGLSRAAREILRANSGEKDALRDELQATLRRNRERFDRLLH